MCMLAVTVPFEHFDWQLDGYDILYLVRTLYDDAHNYHDSDRITFDRQESLGDLVSRDLVSRDLEGG